MRKKYLTELEQSRLLLGVSKLADPLAQRDFHWIGALILTGMRIQEFSRLTVPMVQQALAVGWLVSPKAHCKGGKRSNEYMVTAQLRTHLEALVKLSHALGAGCEVPAEGQPLVWGRDVAGIAGPLSVRSYEARLKHWAVHAQLDARISPHWLRHTRGMNIMRRSRGSNLGKGRGGDRRCHQRGRDQKSKTHWKTPWNAGHQTRCGHADTYGAARLNKI